MTNQRTACIGCWDIFMSPSTGHVDHRNRRWEHHPSGCGESCCLAQMWRFLLLDASVFTIFSRDSSMIWTGETVRYILLCFVFAGFSSKVCLNEKNIEKYVLIQTHLRGGIGKPWCQLCVILDGRDSSKVGRIGLMPSVSLCSRSWSLRGSDLMELQNRVGAPEPDPNTERQVAFQALRSWV